MFRKTYKALTVILSSVLVLSSCLRSTGTVTINATATSTEIESTVPAISSTPILPIVSPSPTLSLPSIKTQCVANSSSSQKLDLNGVIILEKIAHQLNSPLGFYFVDPNTKNIIKTDNQGIVTKVSPDGKHIAYEYDSPSGDKGFIRILDSHGKIISDFLSKFDGLWEDYFNWQSSEQLRIVTTNINDVYPYLINPFTQEQTTLKTDWAGAYHPVNPYQDQVADWKFDQKATSINFVYGANILYDPTLTRVLFPKTGSDVSLINAESGAEIAHANLTDWGRLPNWSPDGEYLTIINREGNIDEFYLVSRDASEFQQITNFAKEFDFVSISEYTWSPGSKQIAFWLKRQDDKGKDGAQSELAILDIPTRQVTRLCIQGISNSAHEPWSMNHAEPIWSPDGKYLLITQWDNVDSPKNYSVLVVDPRTSQAENISKNTAPIGWMIKNP